VIVMRDGRETIGETPGRESRRRWTWLLWLLVLLPWWPSAALLCGYLPLRGVRWPDLTAFLLFHVGLLAPRDNVQVVVTWLAIAGMCLLAHRATRVHWRSFLLAAGLLVVACRCQLDVFWWAEDRAFAALAARSEPLIQALERYRADHQRYPESLEDLVPAYLASVPATGWCVCPRYHYRLVEYRLTWRLPDGRALRAGFDTHGDAAYIVPFPRDDTMDEALRRLGPPERVERGADWVMQVDAEDLFLCDERFLRACSGAPTHRSRFGRWTFIWL
jgi:hypothetical protein